MKLRKIFGILEKNFWVVSMSIDETTLDKIAGLAKIKIEKKDKEQYLDSFNKILNSMDALSEIDTTDATAFSYESSLSASSREDKSNAVTEQDQIKSNAPAMNHGYFLVPKVIEG